MKYENLREYIIEIIKNGIIYREDKKFFEILKHEKLLKEFFKEKFFYDLIIERKLIKLERIPDEVNISYGIQEFNKKEQYIIFLLILDFLEEIEDGRSILISDIVSYITDNYPEEIDWKNYYLNLSLIKVLKYCNQLKIVNLIDGSEQEYLSNLNGDFDLLYQNTGISKHFMIRLPLITENLETWEDYKEINKNEMFNDKLCIARRSLINNTIVNIENPAYEIIRNNAESLDSEFEIYFKSKLIVTDKFAYLLNNKEDRAFSNIFPDTKNTTTIAFLFCDELKHQLKTEFNNLELIDILSNTVKNNMKIISNENKRKEPEELLSDILNLLEEVNIIKSRTLEKICFSDFIYHLDIGLGGINE